MSISAHHPLDVIVRVRALIIFGGIHPNLCLAYRAIYDHGITVALVSDISRFRTLESKDRFALRACGRICALFRYVAALQYLNHTNLLLFMFSYWDVGMGWVNAIPPTTDRSQSFLPNGQRCP
jgi:hypothetical protein